MSAQITRQARCFTVEGTVTAGNIEPNAFYDTIYIQDATGGINIYPVATTDGTFQVGQKVRVTGSWDQYQGGHGAAVHPYRTH